jgi:hypothetical protein
VTLAVVIAVDLEHRAENPLDRIVGVWTFSGPTLAEVWTERKLLEDPTIGYGTFAVDLDAGISELPTKDRRL